MAPTNPDARLVVVEGEIGAGKTELAKALAQELTARGKKVSLVLEPVERWCDVGILPKFYADRARHGYGFQTFVFATRVTAIVDAVARAPDADVFILERSPATDGIFMELQRGVVDPVEMGMYAVWCDAYRRLLPVDLTRATVLYLKTNIDRCMTRLESRARAGEVASEDTDEAAKQAEMRKYQCLLRKAHEAFLQGKHAGAFPHMPPSPYDRASVVEIAPRDADGNFRDAGPEKDRIVRSILAQAGFDA